MTTVDIVVEIGSLSSLVRSDLQDGYEWIIEPQDSRAPELLDGLAEVMYEHWWLDHKREDGPDNFAKCPICSVNDAGKFFLFHGPSRYKDATRCA